MSNENENLYQERLNRIQKAINLEPVDKVPCIFMGTAFAPRYMGMSQHKFCTDGTAAVDVTIEAMKRLGDVDGINLPTGGIHPMGMTFLWLSRVLIPGIDLDEDALWQVVEKEIMTRADYDLIIDKGVDALFEKILPQVCDIKMMEENSSWYKAHGDGIAEKFRNAGYAIVAHGAVSTPFDTLCGARSMNQFFFDLYRVPDKVEEAMNEILPFFIKHGIRLGAGTMGVPGVWVGGWRTASAMLAPKLWDRFAWPHIKKIVEALVDQGINPVLHWDQDWTRDLERLLELPAKKCVLNLDGMTDIRKAREILKDHMAIMGDVPPTILSTGSPEDVRNYIRDLVRDVGPNGLLIAPGCDAPLNAKPENMEAFVASSREFGAL